MRATNPFHSQLTAISISIYIYIYIYIYTSYQCSSSFLHLVPLSVPWYRPDLQLRMRSCRNACFKFQTQYYSLVLFNFIFFCLCFVLFVCLFVSKEKISICNFKFSLLLGISLSKSVEVTLYRLCIVSKLS